MKACPQLAPLQLAPLQFSCPRSCPIGPHFVPIWVDLVTAPDLSASDQALLLLPCGEQDWLAWIPDYGEIILHPSQFYEPQSWN